MAMAQTPADIARQVWPLHAPAAVYGSIAPHVAPVGSFTSADLARLMAVAPGHAANSQAPASGSFSAGAFAGQDLARLAGRDAVPRVAGAPQEDAAGARFYGRTVQTALANGR
jgi:hypothetical protein